MVNTSRNEDIGIVLILIKTFRRNYLWIEYAILSENTLIII